jgi:predicted ATP-grasp superfamily ATP-dependent carboligase
VSIDEGEDAYINSLLEHVKRLKPTDDRPYVLMPVFRNTRVIARHREKFEPYISIAAPTAESISKVFPKGNLVATAEETGANAPLSIHTEDSEALRKEIGKLRMPVMLKPVSGVGGRGIKTFDNADAAIDAHRTFVDQHGEAPLIQEKVEGEDYCFTGLFKDGELLAHMAYTNVSTFPQETGAGSVRETVDDSVFVAAARSVMKPTGWTGVAEIDFMWTGKEEDEAHIIEVNPRFWAGLFHSVKSGIDFPWLLYQLTVKGEIDAPGEAIIGQKTKAPGLWLASMAQDVATSDIHFDRLKTVWSDKLDWGLFKRLKFTGVALRSAVDFDDACFRVAEALDASQESSDELSEYDDPFAGLGILFVLSSLAKHGKLPDEVKF